MHMRSSPAWLFATATALLDQVERRAGSNARKYGCRPDGYGNEKLTPGESNSVNHYLPIEVTSQYLDK